MGEERSQFAVTTILPVYNAENFLERTLALVEASVIPYSELILINDGSTDSTSSIVTAFAKKHTSVRLIEFSHNRGVAAARNVALASVRTKYVWFADADDAWSNEIIPKLLETALRAGADISWCRAVLHRTSSEADAVIDGIDKNAVLSRDQTLQHMLTGEFNGFLWNKLFTTKVLGTDPFASISSQSDFTGALSAVSRAAKVSSTGEVLYTHIERLGSVSRARTPVLANLEQCLHAMKAVVSAPWASERSRSLLEYFEVWFYLLPLANTPLRYGSNDDVVLSSLHASRQGLKKMNLRGIAKHSRAAALNAYAVVLLGRLYPRFFRALRRVKTEGQ